MLLKALGPSMTRSIIKTLFGVRVPQACLTSEGIMHEIFAKCTGIHDEEGALAVLVGPSRVMWDSDTMSWCAGGTKDIVTSVYSALDKISPDAALLARVLHQVQVKTAHDAAVALTQAPAHAQEPFLLALLDVTTADTLSAANRLWVHDTFVGCRSLAEFHDALTSRPGILPALKAAGFVLTAPSSKSGTGTGGLVPPAPQAK